MNVSNEQQELLKAILEANNKQTEELKQYINKELQEIKEEICRERDRITELEKKYTELNEKYKSLGKSLKKNNIIVFGLGYITGNLLDFALNKLNSLLELTLTPGDISNLYTVGNKQGDKPIIIKFTTFLQKQNILRNCNKLKGTTIRISEDLSIEERSELKELQKYYKKARSKNIRAYIKGIKLYMNGKYYTVKQLEGLEELGDIESLSEEEYVHAQFGSQAINTNPQQKDKRKLVTTEAVGIKIATSSGQGRSSARLAEKTTTVDKKGQGYLVAGKK